MENQIQIGSVVRLASSPRKTKELGIVKAIHNGTPLFPGEHFDVAWTGHEQVSRCVPNHHITLAD